jgi:ribosomal protein S18 acetylase RimI-like enzyme
MKIIKIDKYNDRVFEAVLKLLPQLNPDLELPEKQHFKNLFESENIRFFILETDNNPIAGMLTVGTYHTLTGLKAWIEDVVVDEPERGKGLGKELIHSAIDYSRSLGAKDISLTSNPVRVEANQLYQKIGFKKYDTNVYKFKLK